jgi:hypothetical protein
MRALNLPLYSYFFTMNFYSAGGSAPAKALQVGAVRLAAVLLALGLANCSRPPEHSGVPAMSAVAIAPAAPVAAPSGAEAAPASANATPAGATAVARPARGSGAAPAPNQPVAEPLRTATVRPATRTQAGRVLDESGQPLVGATVILRGTTKGTSTDATGSYSLEVPAGDNSLVVGYGGYEDETVTTHNAQPLTVTLLPKAGATMSSVPNPKTKARHARR